jgi:hypothetical protein
MEDLSLILIDIDWGKIIGSDIFFCKRGIFFEEVKKVYELAVQIQHLKM